MAHRPAIASRGSRVSLLLAIAVAVPLGCDAGTDDGAAGDVAELTDEVATAPTPSIPSPADEPPTVQPPVAAGEVTSADGSWQVRWRAEPSPIPLDVPFAVEVAITPMSPVAGAADGAGAITGFSIDARMPHHRHGMLVRPTTRRLGPGRFRAEGLMLHMPGYWELHFDVVGRDGLVERAQASFEVDG